jgi:ribonuclease D
MRIITTTQELSAACERLAQSAFVAVDTEFMRETTYWPKLCLIQMASENVEAIVDPLASGIDLSAFFVLMSNEAVVKVFHSGRQDIEIIHNLAKIIPHPIFDTQVAAMVCGFGESVSYDALVKRLLKLHVDKGARFTDWSKRPLRDAQLAYALGDVTHLRGVYLRLRKQLDDSGRASWLDEEMGELTDRRNYEFHPENAWQRLKMRVKTRKAIGVMMELAKWREKVAQQQDVPRGRVLKDEAIYDIAQQAPQTVADLSALRTINEGLARSARGREILETVERGLKRKSEDLPDLKSGQPLSPAAAAVTDLLRVLLKAVAASHEVAAKLIATSDDLDKIALDDNADVHALRGWRRDLFGESALALKAGRLALAVCDGEVTLLPLAQCGPPAPLPKTRGRQSGPDHGRSARALPGRHSGPGPASSAGGAAAPACGAAPKTES